LGAVVTLDDVATHAALVDAALAAATGTIVVTVCVIAARKLAFATS
jgi:hypothetical protein